MPIRVFVYTSSNIFPLTDIKTSAQYKQDSKNINFGHLHFHCLHTCDQQGFSPENAPHFFSQLSKPKTFATIEYNPIKNSATIASKKGIILPDFPSMHHKILSNFIKNPHTPFKKYIHFHSFLKVENVILINDGDKDDHHTSDDLSTSPQNVPFIFTHTHARWYIHFVRKKKIVTRDEKDKWANKRSIYIFYPCLFSCSLVDHWVWFSRQRQRRRGMMKVHTWNMTIIHL